MATKENVLSATLRDPANKTYPVISATVNRRATTSPDVMTARVIAPSRFRRALEFTGSFVVGGTPEMVRTILPEPIEGVELDSVGWELRVFPPRGIGEDDEEFGELFGAPNLVLSEVSIADWSKAASALGPAVGDAGGDRMELLDLSFVDPRAFWRETGHVAGRRNFRDPDSTLAVSLAVPGEDGGEELFDPSSVRGEGGAIKLHSAFDLLEEIAERCPFLTAEDDSLITPADSVGKLKELFPLDIDYGIGSDPATAFGKIAAMAGLVIGLQIDNRLFVDFDTTPSETLIANANIPDRAARFSNEECGARIKPRTPAVRFYPSRVVKQIPLIDWEPIAKDDKNNILTLPELAGQAGLAGREGEVAYAMAVKGMQELPADKEPGEKELLNRLEGTATREEAQKFRRLSGWTFRGYRYAPTEETVGKVRKIVEAQSATAREALRDSSRAPAKLGGAGGDAESVLPIIQPFQPSALLDRLLSAPLRTVGKVEGVGELKAAFFGDLLLHRYYTFLDTARNIVVDSYPPPDFEFKSEIFDRLAKEFEIFDARRRPTDWSEAGAQAITLQTRYRTDLLPRDGNPTDDLIRKFWNSLFESPKTGLPSMEMFVSWVSGDATEFLDSFDERAGIVQFKVPLGRFVVHRSFTGFLRRSVPLMKAQADDIDASASEFGGATPVIDATLFRTWARILEEIGKEDASARATLGAIGPPQFPDALDDFPAVVKAFRDRSPFGPLWQIAALKVSVEDGGSENETEGSPDDVTAAGDSDEEIPLDAPIDPPEPQLDLSGDGTQTVATPTGPDLETVATPVDAPAPVLVAMPGQSARLSPSPLLALVYVEAPFDEAAWPRIEFGERGPFRIERLVTPWVENFNRSEPENLKVLEAEASRRWEEINAESTVENSEEIEIAEVFFPDVGAVVRSASFSFGEGGANPVVRVSSSRLASRRQPLLRVAQVVQDQAGKAKSNEPKPV